MRAALHIVSRAWFGGGDVYSKHHAACARQQGRPVIVKHGAGCAMGKVGGKTKNQRGGNFNVLL